ASADASVSYDARRVLFAGRPTRHDHWQIWEVDLVDGVPHRLVTCREDCVRPLYLPNGRIVYTRITPTGSTIEVAAPNGGVPDVLTHVPGRYLTNDVLRDGRILFEWRGDLFTVYPDGTGVEALRCDHGPQRSGGRQGSSGDILFDTTGGLGRFVSALAQQVSFPAPRLEIAGPLAELPSGHWLAAARTRTGGAYGIYQAEDPTLHDARPLEFPPGLNAIQPMVVASRMPPRDFPSGLVPTRTTANLLCLDVRESRTPIQGKVHWVRFYSLGSGGKQQVLGQTSVASDGSFYVEVPADRPLRMELLDEMGTCLRSEDHWFWMRASEQRICVGCHAGPERAPENKVPEILNRIVVPVRMLGEVSRTP
ncbi:MAG TPA: hypothetical protein VGL72_24050, partial [Bryobacteraceae bacterium]